MIPSRKRAREEDKMMVVFRACLLLVPEEQLASFRAVDGPLMVSIGQQQQQHGVPLVYRGIWSQAAKNLYSTSPNIQTWMAASELDSAHVFEQPTCNNVVHVFEANQDSLLLQLPVRVKAGSGVDLTLDKDDWYGGPHPGHDETLTTSTKSGVRVCLSLRESKPQRTTAPPPAEPRYDSVVHRLPLDLQDMVVAFLPNTTLAYTAQTHHQDIETRIRHRLLRPHRLTLRPCCSAESSLCEWCSHYSKPFPVLSSATWVLIPYGWKSSSSSSLHDIEHMRIVWCNKRATYRGRQSFCCGETKGAVAVPFARASYGEGAVRFHVWRVEGPILIEEEEEEEETSQVGLELEFHTQTHSLLQVLSTPLRVTCPWLSDPMRRAVVHVSYDVDGQVAAFGTEPIVISEYPIDMAGNK